MATRVKIEELESPEGSIALRSMCQSFTSNKLQLHSLNDRLTRYFDRVRFLEMENGRPAEKIHAWSNISAIYERELVKVRKALNETATEKSKLEITNARLREENDYYKRTLRKQCTEVVAAPANEQSHCNIQNTYGLNLMECTTMWTEYHAKFRFQNKNVELRAENEKLKFIIVDSDAQLRAEKRHKAQLENEIVHLRQKVAQLRQKCNVAISFDDEHLAIRDKLQRQLHVPKSKRRAKVSSKSLVVHRYHRYKSKMNGERPKRRVSIGSKRIGRMPTAAAASAAAASSQATGRSQISQLFQRLKTTLKLLDFDKIKETCIFIEFGNLKKNYFRK